MSPSTLFLLVAFLCITLVASGAVNHDDPSASIASALLDALGGSTTVPTTPKASKMKSYSSSNSTSNSTSSSDSGHKKLASSKRPATPIGPSAAYTAGLASIVPVTAVVITLAMVGFRLYLNRIEDEFNPFNEKDSEWAGPKA